jgi:GTPase SAR1 family protein
MIMQANDLPVDLARELDVINLLKAKSAAAAQEQVCHHVDFVRFDAVVVTLLSAQQVTEGEVANSEQILPGGATKRAQELLAQALAQGKKEWRRSKLSIVGEGRAGKTALTNSIIGRAFEETASTVGINQLTCDVRQIKAAGGEGGLEQRWGECARAEKELEAALAEMVLRGLREPNSHVGSAAETSGGDNIMTFMRAQQQREPIAEPATLSDDTVPVVDGYVGSLVSKESEIRMQMSTRTASPHVEQARTAAEVVATTADTSPDEASAGANTELQSATFARGAVAVDLDEEMVMKALATLQDTDTGLLISLFDFGGQSVFEVIHHLFLTRNGVYALVFNMEWLAHDGPEKGKALRFMRNWLSSIAVHTLDRSTGMSAPVVFVGTRLDHISTGAQHEQISTVLYEIRQKQQRTKCRHQSPGSVCFREPKSSRALHWAILIQSTR